ncbi:MAG: ABC transporter permease [Bryobacteraceae bacterium]
MQSIIQDLRFGARILTRSPGISAAVILALALGIGANSAMFSVVDALLIHPFHYRDPSTLTAVLDRDAQGVIRYAAAGNFLDMRARSKSFSGLAAYTDAAFALSGQPPRYVSGARVTANFFQLLGIEPVLGRAFLPGEDGLDSGSSSANVVVIGNQFWKGDLGGDPNVLGRKIVLSSIPYSIVGVLPPDFRFTTDAQIWVPVSNGDLHDRDYHYLGVIGRLKTTLASAQRELAEISHDLDREYPKSNKGWTIDVEDLRERRIGVGFRTRLWLLFGAAGIVLAVACANIASLLLGRSAARSREIAVRSALGATPIRLARQLLTESAMLSLIGGASGLVFAFALVRAAPSILPANISTALGPISLNGAAVLFTFGIAVLTGILFGLAPAIAAARGNAQESLKDSSRGSTGGRGHQRFRNVLVAAEVAVATILLSSGGLMLESLKKVSRIDLGFDPKNVLAFRLYLAPSEYNLEKTLQLHREALRRIAALPGVTVAAAGSDLPATNYTMEVPFDLEEAPPRDEGERPGVGYVSVSPGYFQALEIPLRRGRIFSETDDANAPPVVMVNQAFVRRYFPNQDPVGRRILLNRPIFEKTGFAETIHPRIVGIAGNVKLSDLGAADQPIVYTPEAQNIWSPSTWFAVRSQGDPSNLSAAIRREFASLGPDDPVDRMAPLARIVSSRLAEPRFQLDLMGAFALLALILAMVGLYAVNAYAVEQRRHEIGIRMALGATPRQVLVSVLSQGLGLTAIGIGLGLIGAVASASLLKGVLVEVSATDPPTLAAVAILLGIVSAAACYIPAHRATQIDPAIALKQQ